MDRCGLGFNVHKLYLYGRSSKHIDFVDLPLIQSSNDEAARETRKASDGGR